MADDLYETVLGAGLLSYESERGRVGRHLITARVDVQVDRSTAQITVRLQPNTPTRLEDRDFLNEDDGYRVELAEPIRGRVAVDAPHPLSSEITDLLRQWASMSIAQGVRFEPTDTRREATTAVPHLSLAPALVLRKRDRSAWVDYYDSMAQVLRGPDAASPLGLAQLVCALDERERLAWASQGRGSGDAFGEDPLFPLPTNEAQRDVLDRLRSDTAAVVQGPPGTGKTHTIANLVSALLAQGHRVLVTSQKDQALRVLRQKLPAPVRDLCVLLTGMQRGAMDELDRSITALANRAARTNPERLERNISQMEDQRASLRSDVARVREQIRALREAEWYEHPEIVPGYRGTIAEIVRTIGQQRSLYGWAHGLPKDAPDAPPLDANEVFELRALLAAGSAARATRRTQWLPTPADLPAVDVVRQLAEAEATAVTAASTPSPLVDQLSALPTESLGEIGRHLDAAAGALQRLGMPQAGVEWNENDWRATALTDRLARKDELLWQNAARGAATAQSLPKGLDSGAHRIHIPPMAPAEAEQLHATGTDLRAYLAGGGQLRKRMRHPKHKAASRLLETCAIDGHAPQSIEDLDIVLRQMHAELAVGELAKQWAYVGVDIGEAPLPIRLSRLSERSDAMREVAVSARPGMRSKRCW